MRNLISVCQDQQKLKVNLHPAIPLLIRESDFMIKMELPVPMVALTLYAKQEHFNLVQDSLQVSQILYSRFIKHVMMDYSNIEYGNGIIWIIF